MRKKQILKITIDILMIAALLLLMAYSLVGEAAHEWIGVGIFVLFVMHHVLNSRWWHGAFRGKYSRYRILQTSLVALVLITMCGSMVSGVLLSRTVFAFLGKRGGQALAGTVHMLCAYWGFAFLSMHLGLHWNMMMNRAGRIFRKRSAARARAVRVLGCLVAVYGLYAFRKRGILSYMLLQVHFVFFDFRESLFFYLLDYAAVMGFFVWIGYYLALFLRRK